MASKQGKGAKSGMVATSRAELGQSPSLSSQLWLRMP